VLGAERLITPVIDGAYKLFPDGRQVCLPNAAGRRLYRARTLEMASRQNFICPKCSQRMTPEIGFVNSATFEHGDLRGMGGARRNDDPNAPGNCAMCAKCNYAKGSRR